MSLWKSLPPEWAPSTSEHHQIHPLSKCPPKFIIPKKEEVQWILKLKGNVEKVSYWKLFNSLMVRIELKKTTSLPSKRVNLGVNSKKLSIFSSITWIQSACVQSVRCTLLVVDQVDIAEACPNELLLYEKTRGARILWTILFSISENILRAPFKIIIIYICTSYAALTIRKFKYPAS